MGAWDDPIGSLHDLECHRGAVAGAWSSNGKQCCQALRNAYEDALNMGPGSAKVKVKP